MTAITRRTTAALVAAGAALALSACVGHGPGNDGDEDLAPGGEPRVTETGEGGAGQDQADMVTLEEGWMAATLETTSAAYGTLSNGSDEPVTITAATSSVASEVQLHEMAPEGEDGMQVAEDGFTLPAGGEVVLEPGAEHLMMLGLIQPLEPGAEATIELTTADGRTTSVTVVAQDVPANQGGRADGDDDDTQAGED
ncbi:copper chaperone PCu(A)C [Ruania suaedae]|uniref:copper chaperone PCu(A)C n=1 Tax=Ruania suaedae TaxID=2897774 RepID=UPI001E3040F8|nr:copper chaperone PCu(A)C [Ruania suaedae]UFU02519.1 copper chaperone PCu(A)C [Ruania suaedae]